MSYNRLLQLTTNHFLLWQGMRCARQCDAGSVPLQAMATSVDHIRLHDHEQNPDVDVLLAPPELKQPPLYSVVILNDDYTPMDFVIEILQEYFSLELDRATQVMLTVHHTGKGIAGIYPRDIAETKANQVNNYARSEGHPLLCQIEPQE